MVITQPLFRLDVQILHGTINRQYLHNILHPILCKPKSYHNIPNQTKYIYCSHNSVIFQDRTTKLQIVNGSIYRDGRGTVHPIPTTTSSISSSRYSSSSRHSRIYTGPGPGGAVTPTPLLY